VADGDRELSGSCLLQTSSWMDVGVGGELDLLLGRGADSPGEPLRRQRGL
jgi:hypothetical protein